MEEKNNNIHFKFISEKPKIGNDEDKLLFGHEEIVETLRLMTFKSPESFTIGLYGKWGVGKSTIVETLQEKLRTDNIPLIIFDVWKHEGDGLRRTFLKKIHKYLFSDKKWKKYYEGKEQLSHNLESTTKDTISENPTFKDIIIHTTKFFLAVIIFILFVWLILDKFFNVIDFKKADINTSIIVFLGLLPVSFVVKLIISFFEKLQGSKTEIIKNKFEDPFEFESLFKKILTDLKKPIKKIVIVFDNLDRVTGDVALQIMSTIKTFLDPIDKELEEIDIVFIIPCDETAIKQHLNKTLTQNKKSKNINNYTNEYLRKFFNTIIWIPDFYNNELEELTNKILEQTEIKEFVDNELAALIVIAFNENPRQVIQFVNILISNYILLRKREIDDFEIDKNIPQLAKYIILIQRHPSIMNYYKCTNIFDLNEEPHLVNINEVHSDVSDKELQSFKNFNEQTRHIQIKSLEIFFKLRKSVFESTFNNSTRLLKIIQNQESKILTLNQDNEKFNKENFNKIKEYIDNLELNNNAKEFNLLIKEKLELQKNSILAVNFIKGLLYLTKSYDLQLFMNTQRAIYNWLSYSNNDLHIFEAEFLIKEYYEKIENRNLKNKVLKVIKNQWINSSKEYLEAVMENSTADFGNYKDYKSFNERFVETFDDFFNYLYLFNKNDFKSIKPFIAKVLSSHFEYFDKISKNKTTREYFSSPEFLINYIDEKLILNPEILKNIPAIKLVIDQNKTMPIINNYEDVFFNAQTIDRLLEYLNQYILKLDEIVNSERKKELDNDFMNISYKLLCRIINLMQELDLNDVIKQRKKNLFNTLNLKFKHNNYINADIYFKYFYSFSILMDNKTTIINTMNNFINSFSNAKILKDIISDAVEISKFFENTNNTQAIFSKSNTQKSFLIEFYNYFSDNDKQRLITYYIPLNSNRNLDDLDEVVNSLKDNIPNVDLFADELLKKANSSRLLKEKKKLLENLFKLKLSKKYDYQKFSDFALSLINTNDININIFAKDLIIERKKVINEIKLKSTCESYLKNSYFKNINTYHKYITNILLIKFPKMKRFISDELSDNINLRVNISNFIVLNNDLELHNLLLKNLYKKNQVELNTEILNKIINSIRPNNRTINKYHSILTRITIDNKYKNELKAKIATLVDSYENLNSEPDELIEELKKIK